MIYTLEADKKINLKAKGVERILQNGCNILSVTQGEVVLERGIGIDGDIVDSPLNKAKKRINIKEQFERYEPRLKIDQITYTEDHQSGVLRPLVEVRIVE